MYYLDCSSGLVGEKGGCQLPEKPVECTGEGPTSAEVSTSRTQRGLPCPQALLGVWSECGQQ